MRPDASRPPFFDGMEGEGTLVVPCPCGKTARTPLWSWLDTAEGSPSPDLADELDLVPFTAHGRTRYRTIHGMSPYVGTVACTCGRVLRVVLGLDEVQPMRWRAALHAVD